jgi:hypothetical protein
MGVASLVLGIASIFLAIFPVLYGHLGALIVGVIGIIIGSIAKKNKVSYGSAGFVLSVIGTTLTALFFVACGLLVGAAGNFLNSLR